MKEDDAVVIESYELGKMVIGRKQITSDLILLPNGCPVRDWARADEHALCVDDLRTILENPPKILVIGTGMLGGMKVPESVLECLREKGVQAEAYRTGPAADMFNDLVNLMDDVFGAFHLGD